MTKITPASELHTMYETLVREIRKDELYRAMLTVERLGGASPEETAVISALGERMQELDGAEYPRNLPAQIGAEPTPYTRITLENTRGSGAGAVHFTRIDTPPLSEN